MTVSNTTNRTSAVGTNAVGQEVAFSFPINATSDLVVMTRVTADGTEATLTETTDYTVAINGDSGGTVTMVTAIATTSEIHLIRVTPKTQSRDLVAGGSFDAENVEDSFDKLTKLVIELFNDRTRSLRAPDTDGSSTDLELPDAISRANRYLYFDGNGDPTVVASVDASAITVSAFGESLVDDANAAAARTTLGLVIGTDVQAYDAGLADIAALTPTNSYFIVGDGSNWVRETGSAVLTSLGISAFIQTVLNDADAATARATLEVTELDDIVTYGGDVVVYNGNVVTYS